MPTSRKPSAANPSAGEMARREIGKHLGALRQQLPQAARDGGKKQVHDLRVETRRCSAALKLYAAFLPKKKAARLEKRIRKMRGAAGRVRDLDVLIDVLKQDKTREDTQAVLKLAKKDRKRAQKELDRARRDVRDAGFDKEAGRFIELVNKRTRKDGPRFAAWARLQLRPLAEGFFAAMPRSTEPKLKELHAFRIKAKELRYTMEMLDSAFSLSFRKQLTARIEAIQDRLGEINDIATRRKRLEKWRQEAKSRKTARRLREMRALDASRIAQLRADFMGWCTPSFLAELRAGFDAALQGLSVVRAEPLKGHVGSS